MFELFYTLLYFFIFFFSFVSICYFLSNMLVESESLRTFTSCQRKTNGVKVSRSTFIILLLFSFSCFFRIVLTGKCFCELALVFVKGMSKNTFHRLHNLHNPQALMSGLTSSPVKPFNPSLSIFCSFGSILP